MIMAGSLEPKLDHPTQKPLLLFETPMRNHLRAGQGVYDPFCGSGTAIIAAERTGCRAYALEIDPRFVDVFRSLAGRRSAARRRRWPMAEPRPTRSPDRDPYQRISA